MVVGPDPEVLAAIESRGNVVVFFDVVLGEGANSADLGRIKMELYVKDVSINCSVVLCVCYLLFLSTGAKTGGGTTGVLCTSWGTNRHIALMALVSLRFVASVQLTWAHNMFLCFSCIATFFFIINSLLSVLTITIHHCPLPVSEDL